MTLITEALDRVARQCSIKAPSSWVTATRTDHVELRDDFFAETIDDILERVDLASPIAAQTTITGDGSETYALPSNFKRLQRDQLAVYDTSLDIPCVPVTTDGEWTYLQDIGTAGVVRYYRLTGYDGAWSISFYGAPDGVDVTVSYITKNWMANASATAGDMFTDETDVLMLPRRVVEAGTVWRYRERRGLPYADKYNEYQLLLDRLSNDTRTRRMINMGGTNNNVRWQDLVPAFIPAS